MVRRQNHNIRGSLGSLGSLGAPTYHWQETSEAGRRVPEHTDESGDGDSSFRNSEGSPNGSNSHSNSFSKSSGNGTDSRQGHRREGGGGSNSIGSDGTSRLTQHRSRFEATLEEEGGTSVSLESSTDSNNPGRRGGGRGSGGLQVFGKQRGEIERMPDPSVDWEVAVVMASNSGEDMVRRAISLCGMWSGDDGP